MDFGVKRISSDGASRRYHLYNNQERLVMVADQGSPWLSANFPHRVQFSQPDGQVIATLDLPRVGRKEGGKGAQHVDYVVILNYAVYAIINEYRWTAVKGEKRQPPYYILEVDQKLWLAQPQGSDSLFLLYDEVPPKFAAHETLAVPDLLEANGRIQLLTPDTAEYTSAYHFIVELSPDQMEHAGLVVLALIFLIDRAVQGIR